MKIDPKTIFSSNNETSGSERSGCKAESQVQKLSKTTDTLEQFTSTVINNFFEPVRKIVDEVPRTTSQEFQTLERNLLKARVGGDQIDARTLIAKRGDAGAKPYSSFDVANSLFQTLETGVDFSIRECARMFQADLKATLTMLAQSSGKFESIMKNAMGPLFNDAIVSEIREAVLRDDFRFLPGVEFAASSTAVFDSAANIVKIPSQYANSAIQSSLAFAKSITDFVAGSLFQGKGPSSSALLASLFQGTAQGSPAISGFYGDPIGDAMEKGKRIEDAYATLSSVTGTLAWGAGHAILERFSRAGEGFGSLFSGDLEGAKNKFCDAAKNPLFSVFDAGAVILVSATSAVQTLIGLEKPARRLTESEIESLRKVYGDSIDYDQIRVKEDTGGILGIGGRAFTIGNTIYITDKEEVSDALLVHEAGHAWQFQHGGLDYISDALISRYLGGEGYDLAAPLIAGKSWEELNPEQQAELMQQAFQNGFFDSEGQRFMIRSKESEGGEGGDKFEVMVIDEDSPALEEMIENGWTDATEQVQDGHNHVQAGTGAT